MVLALTVPLAAIFAAAMVRFTFVAMAASVLVAIVIAPGKERKYLALILVGVIGAVALGLSSRPETSARFIAYTEALLPHSVVSAPTPTSPAATTQLPHSEVSAPTPTSPAATTRPGCPLGRISTQSSSGNSFYVMLFGYYRTPACSVSALADLRPGPALRRPKFTTRRFIVCGVWLDWRTLLCRTGNPRLCRTSMARTKSGSPVCDLRIGVHSVNDAWSRKPQHRCLVVSLHGAGRTLAKRRVSAPIRSRREHW